MLTHEENELLVHVGPGQPAGELLRRYWHPVAPACDLTPEEPTRFVRILGEDLVLFRDTQGRVGLLADHCAHRGASLLYGRVEERGISCAYHGWLYDTAGNILETPPERNDAICKHVKQRAYPVQKLVGLYWAYLGPPPAPVIPKYDVWVRQDGRRWIELRGILDCNWFQAMENSVDSAHLQILHQEFVGRGRKPASTTRGFIDDIAAYEFELFEYGIMKRRTYANGQVDAHPLLFPTVLRQGNATQIRVPVDDTHTWHLLVHFEPAKDGSLVPDEGDPPVRHARYHKEPANALHPDTRYTMHSVAAQDHAMWETQGAIPDRSGEHLSYSDRGVVMLRRLVKDQIERVQQGHDPLGLIRDPDHPMIDTNLTGEAQGVYSARYPVGIGAAVLPDADATRQP
jgi:5,5'-dehydrodivanillate O-demethylase oxygenase subunit